MWKRFGVSYHIRMSIMRALKPKGTSAFIMWGNKYTARILTVWFWCYRKKILIGNKSGVSYDW